MSSRQMSRLTEESPCSHVQFTCAGSGPSQQRCCPDQCRLQAAEWRHQALAFAVVSHQQGSCACRHCYNFVQQARLHICALARCQLRMPPSSGSMRRAAGGVALLLVLLAADADTIR